MPIHCKGCGAHLDGVEAYEAFVIKRTPPGGNPQTDPQAFAISSLGPFCKACWEDLMAEYQEENPCWKGAASRKQAKVNEMLTKLSPEERDQFERWKAQELQSTI